MRQCVFIVVLMFGAACAETEVASVDACSTMCGQLVQVCGLGGFPDAASCESGCLYNQELGANVGAQSACVSLAQCDPFAIVECEHAFGID